MLRFEVLRNLEYPSRTSKYFWNTTIAICLLVGLFVPEKILTDHLWARQFSNFMAAWIPHVDRVSNVLIKVEINRFYYSFLWAYTLLIFVPFYIYEWINNFHGRNKGLMKSLKFKNLLIAILFWGLIVFAFYFEMTDYQRYLGTHNKLFYMAYSHWLVRPLWSFASVTVICIWGIELVMRFIHFMLSEP